eukprot:ANDGO_02754.mRNA.1 hypothetical protein
MSSFEAILRGSDEWSCRGWMYKKGSVRKNWKRRFFIVEKHVLRYFEREPAQDGVVVRKGDNGHNSGGHGGDSAAGFLKELRLEDAIICKFNYHRSVPAPGLTVSFPKRVLCLECESMEQRDTFFRCLWMAKVSYGVFSNEMGLYNLPPLNVPEFEKCIQTALKRSFRSAQSTRYATATATGLGDLSGNDPMGWSSSSSSPPDSSLREDENFRLCAASMWNIRDCAYVRHPITGRFMFGRHYGPVGEIVQRRLFPASQMQAAAESLLSSHHVQNRMIMRDMLLITDFGPVAYLHRKNVCLYDSCIFVGAPVHSYRIPYCLAFGIEYLRQQYQAQCAALEPELMNDSQRGWTNEERSYGDSEDRSDDEIDDILRRNTAQNSGGRHQQTKSAATLQSQRRAFMPAEPPDVPDATTGPEQAEALSILKSELRVYTNPHANFPSTAFRLLFDNKQPLGHVIFDSCVFEGAIGLHVQQLKVPGSRNSSAAADSNDVQSSLCGTGHLQTLCGQSSESLCSQEESHVDMHIDETVFQAGFSKFEFRNCQFRGSCAMFLCVQAPVGLKYEADEFEIVFNNCEIDGTDRCRSDLVSSSSGCHGFVQKNVVSEFEIETDLPFGETMICNMWQHFNGERFWPSLCGYGVVVEGPINVAFENCTIRSHRAAVVARESANVLFVGERTQVSGRVICRDRAVVSCAKGAVMESKSAPKSKE